MPLFRRKTAPTEHQAKKTQVGANTPGLVRSSSIRSNKSNTSLPQTPDSWGDEGFLNGGLPGQRRPQTLVLSEATFKKSPNIPPESLESPLRSTSRLSKTLLEVVRDHNALACLRAFLRSQKSDNLLQFWCDAESFHAATLTRMRTHSHRIQSGRRQRTESGNSVMSERDQSGRCNRANSVSCAESSLESAKRSSLTCEPPPEAVTDVKAISPLHHDVTNEQVLVTDGFSTLHNNPSSGSETLNINTFSNHESSPSSTTVEGNVTINPGLDTATSVSFPQPHSSHSSNEQNKTPVIDAQCEARSVTVSDNDPDVIVSDCAKLAGDGSATDTPAEAVSTPDASENQPDDIGHKLSKSIERDAVTIFSEYIAKDAPHPINVNEDLRSEIISKICQENGSVDPESFVNCQRFVLNRIESEYFSSFRDSAFYCRHQVHMLTSEKVFLPDVLLNENALCYFMEYMEQEGGSDLMQVWLCAANFEQQLQAAGPSYDPLQAQADAMVIYDKYFSLQATNPVGFDDKLRFEIEGNICREEGPLPDCFTKAKNIVLMMLEKTYFPGYLQSQIYHRYLSDLISTVQMDEDIPHRPGGSSCGSQSFRSHKRSESDASSEHSYSSSVSQPSEGAAAGTRNTLLAVDTRRVTKRGTGASSKSGKLNIEAADFSMNIDMFNPDDLWKRPQANKLSLGSVNQLGQFVSDFDHETVGVDRRIASLAPNLFKRRKDREREEEEMALRIAQIIISDVNTMTRTGETMADSSKGT